MRGREKIIIVIIKRNTNKERNIRRREKGNDKEKKDKIQEKEEWSVVNIYQRKMEK